MSRGTHRLALPLRLGRSRCSEAVPGGASTVRGRMVRTLASAILHDMARPLMCRGGLVYLDEHPCSPSSACAVQRFWQARAWCPAQQCAKHYSIIVSATTCCSHDAYAVYALALTAASQSRVATSQSSHTDGHLHWMEGRDGGISFHRKERLSGPSKRRLMPVKPSAQPLTTLHVTIVARGCPTPFNIMMPA